MKPTTLLLPLLLAACAPRVSLGKKAPPPAPVPAPIVAEAAPPPEPTPAPAPVIAQAEPAPPAAQWKAAPPAVELALATSPAEEAAPTKKKSYYAYSDDQIRGLRRSSSDFRRLDDQLKSCSEKSAKAIERREEIPTEIAKIRMSKGGLNAKKEKQIAKLRAEQERLERADHSACAEMEQRLTGMLAGAYDKHPELY